MVTKIARSLTLHPLRYLILTVLFVLTTSYGMLYLQPNFNFKLWFKANDPALRDYEEYEREFGNDDDIIVIVHSPSGVLDVETATIVQELTDKLWKVSDVIRVESLANFQLITGETGDIVIDPVFSDPLTQENLDKRREQMSKNDNVINYLINKNMTTTLVTAHLNPLYNTREQYAVPVTQVKKILKEYEGRGDHVFHMGGSATVTKTYRDVSEGDIMFLMPILVVLTMILLYWIFRSITLSLLVTIIYTLAIFATMGIAGWIGVSFNTMTACVPQILIAITLADSIHLVQGFVRARSAGMNRKDAAFHTFEHNSIPTFMTSVTTGLGFVAFIISDVVTISDLGLLSSIGVMIAWFITAGVLPAMFIFYPLPYSKTLHEKAKSNRKWISAYVDWIAKYKYPTIAAWLIVLLLSLYYNSKNAIDSDAGNYYSDKVPLKQAYNFLRKEFGGSRGIDLVLDSGREDGVKDTAYIKKVIDYQKWIDQMPGVAKSTSIANIVGELHQATEGREIPKYERIPASTEAVAQQLFLYSMSLPVGMGINYWTTMDYRKMRIRVFWEVENSEETLAKIKTLKDKAAEMSLDLKIAGKTALVPTMSNHILNTFNQANTRALIMIFITMIFLCRSLRLGFIAMMPNAIPPVFAGGLMYLFGINYDVGTVLVIAVVMGIAVDDTVHFMTHYQDHLKAGMSSRDAIIEVFDGTGDALLITNLVLTIGFGVAILSEFLPFRNFGVVTIVSLGFALTADWMLLPALLMTPRLGYSLKEKVKKKAA